MHSLQLMTRRCFLVAMLLVLPILGWAQTTTFKNGIRQGQIKVKFSSEVSTTALSNANARSGNGINTGILSIDAAAQRAQANKMYRLFPYDPKFESRLRKHGLHLWYVMEIDASVNPAQAVAQFKNVKEVSIAEVDREKILAPFSATPYTPGAGTLEALPFNDPILKDQWHYHNTGQAGVGDADVNLFEAWQTTAGANNIIVSVHDQGIDVNHKDLRSNIWVNQAEQSGVPGVDDDGNGYVDDVNGYNFQKNKGAVDAEMHGTHVAGTIAAVNNNGIGVSGIAGGTGNNDGVKLMSLQIFGGLFENSYIYAANNGAVISQNSWGYSEPGYFDQSIKDAIDYFIAEAGNYPGSPMRGGIVIFASGNSNYDADWYPGYLPNVLAVSSLGPEWKKAYYSNFGEWVEISATGGDQEYGTKGGVLSTFPRDQYGYLQGTSMACPHVSGIAALALANRTGQMTNDQLWTKIVTGVVNIDEYNPDFINKLGSGAIDAALAIQNDTHVAPEAISNLDVTGISQEFATLSWTVPADADDRQPKSFALYYHTQPITDANLNAATKVTLKNNLTAGEVFEYEVTGLLGLTEYYFAVTSTDRWGNVSVLSNIENETTNQGPSIAVDENSQSIDLTIDVANGTTATHDITILNNETGILRWNHFLRHKSTALSFNAAGIHYPAVTKKAGHEPSISRVALPGKNPLRSNEPAPMAFTEVSKGYAEWPLYMVGETDLSFTNSIAVKFFVNETEGFNLTKVSTYLKHDPAKGPVILEIYKGNSPEKKNLIYAQEHNNWGTSEAWAYITLDEQLYFESGETFWVVVHVPAENLFPFGMGWEVNAEASKNCYYSRNLGATWVSMEEAINDKRFAWNVVAVSENATLGNYITLEPGSGDVDGNSETATTLTAEASNLINGSYSASLVISSNDINQKELRIPVTVMVSGQQANIKHIDIADFGNVFLGTSKTLELVLDNQGFGNFNDPVFNVSGNAFEIDGYAPWQIKAREEAIIKIKFTPSQFGNNNGVLSFTNGVQTYEISLFGVGAETSKIAITPETQTINNLAIGDEVTAEITVENQGAYPLKYFIPGFDTKGVSENWPNGYHTYGYKVRTNAPSESDPLPYAFNDISTTGIDITTELMSTYKYFAVDMGFDFPYYGRKMQTLYVAQKGFTTFDNSVNPVNSPSLNNEYNPRGYISPLGGYFTYQVAGKIFYQVEADRVIVQYDNVWDGYTDEHITAQMVLFANGDIRFYYENMGFSEYNQNALNILIEDYDRHDGILLNKYDQLIGLFSGMAIGFDYPGPNMIKSIENGSGIIPAGGSAVVNVTMDTDSLTEGVVNRILNFISNDPSKSQAYATISMTINQGGTAKPTVSTDTINFGNVFQGDVKSSVFTIKNNGTANVNVSSLAFVNNDFTVVGTQPAVVKPGLYTSFEVKVPTSTLASLEDWLSINYADGTHDTVYLKANIVVAPAFDADLSLLQQTLAQGDSTGVPFTIANTGLGTLEVVASGKQWLSFDAPTTPSDISYTYQKENTGGVYQWIDIRKTGTQLPFYDIVADEGFWRELTLPFPIEFYGQYYTSLKIGDNGIISFEENPTATIFNDNIPSAIHPGPCIMPYWTQSGFDTYTYAAEDVGIFYQFFDDQIIISWEFFVNHQMGFGDPVSAQIIFFKNGTMKFQYKPFDVLTDFTTRLTAIGLQKDSEHGVVISEFLDVDHGKGLAYVVLPAKKFSIAPNTSITGAISMDARNVYGGVYNEVLKIQTNAPGNEEVIKPVELTVTGDAEFTAPDTVDVGTQMIVLEWGWPKMYTKDFTFRNEGVAPYDLTWFKMADAAQGLTLLLEVDGFFGKEWVDISNIYYQDAWETPVYTLMPGDELKARAAFSPSAVGEFSDELIITTTIGEQKIVLTGTGMEPPVLGVEQSPITVNMNTPTETANESIDFDNIAGKSDLSYVLGIEYRRSAETTQALSAPNQADAPASTLELTSTKADSNVGMRTMATYQRTLTHTDKQTPDRFVGNDGAALTLATRYNAGPDGFNVTHVETFMRREMTTAGTIEVEIMAGGNSILESPVVAKGTLEFSGTEGDETGQWYAIKLDKPAVIYPNEDFYVSVSYPFGIEGPQGSIEDSETIEGRYYYNDSGYWYNVQNVTGLETIGWLMFAAEETSPSWLTITSPADGRLASEESAVTDLLFDGGLAQRGDQYANVVFATNDPVNPVVKVPVKLHLNEGPHFSGASTTVVMAEMDTVTLNFNVVDLEGNTFTVAPAQVYEGASHTLANSKLTIKLTPGFDDSGTHHFTFLITDQYDAVTEMVLTVEVIETNQPPMYTAASKTLEYNSVGGLIEYNLGDYFADPDNDDMTFSVVSGNTDIADIFASSDQFLVRPTAMGETTFTFTVTDDQGAVTHETITVKVNSVLGMEEELNAGVKLYPNPVQQFARVLLSYEWKGAVRLAIIDATGRQHVAEQIDATTQHDVQLNVSNLRKGFYILQAVSDDKKVTIKLIKE